ncbi:MAG: glycerate kinase [Candidatus Sumerlaeia bacterium]|nr:glycerate kinase [Candidatus Sumerlaeia bacterium]
MKVVFALNAFKESLSALGACRAVAKGFCRGCPGTQPVIFPVADGGDGTAEALVAATGGRMVARTVCGPLGEPVRARYGILGDGRTAIVEMAKASGLALVPPARRNPFYTTTYGTGELIADALRRGVRRVVVGLGGSATVDMAAGMAQALGAKLLDGRSRPIARGGAALGNLARIDLTELRRRIEGVEIVAATDVTNPLLGPRGGIRVYSPQKGATPAMVRQLETACRNAARVIRRDVGVDVVNVPGAGAAGGFGAGIIAWLGGKLRSGIEVILDAADFDSALDGAALVITGEGRIDRQTAFGKAPAGVAKRAKAAGIPCVAVAGGIGAGSQQLHALGITAVFSLCREPMPLADALRKARSLAEHCGEQLGRLWRAAAH